MFDPSSFVNPTPLAHADASRDVLPRGGNLLGRAVDWYQIFGSKLVQNSAIGLVTAVKTALSKAFPAIQNRKDLETRFYVSQQTEPRADRFCLRFA
ncbi:uncharacterized protein TNCV_334891 [Trichonephila clavipes]|nr:uncharacterized protein TNCV_334891 [Trichonephila clavipes]